MVRVSRPGGQCRDDIYTDLTRLCDRLRVAGVLETTIEDFAERWLRQASIELNETVDRLELLEKLVHSGKEQTTAAFNEYMKLMERVGEVAERPESLSAASAGEPVQRVPPKHPHIKVKLSDLNGEMWPILRRVSYAMSDAGVDEAEIEQYKKDVRSTSDPIGVSRRWIQVA